MVFPTLRSRPSRYVNMDVRARSWLKTKGLPMAPKSAALQPEVAQQMDEEYRRLFGVAFTYGGWGEDRSAIWKGSYLEETKSFIHLGVDFNASAGTPVEADCAGTVMYVGQDNSECGWGGRVMERLDKAPIVLMYAHLEHVTCKVGDVLAVGDIFAEVGRPSHNGGWYPHLHVQAMTLEMYEQFKQDPLSIDGYGRREEWATLQKKFPDPTRYLRI